MTNDVETKEEALPVKPEEKKRYSLSGSKSDAFTNLVGNQVFYGMWLAHSNKKEKKQQLEAAMAAMRGIKPQDETEGMLAAQMVAVHNASMECFRRAMIQEQGLVSRDSNLKHAAKLTRTYATLVETLQKYRGKGQQKMTVEHVTINDGGQAIVGNVEK